MANSVDQDRSTLFAFILNSSVMLGNYLHIDAFFLGSLRVHASNVLVFIRKGNPLRIYYYTCKKFPYIISGTKLRVTSFTVSYQVISTKRRCFDQLFW